MNDHASTLASILARHTARQAEARKTEHTYAGKHYTCTACGLGKYEHGKGTVK